jgi:hypothetical protein
MGSLVSSALSLGGGLISGSNAADAAKGQAEALRAAGQYAYDRSKFNPIGIKTNLGQSQFTMGPDGQLTSAGYSLSPELQAIQQRVIGGAGQYDPYQITNSAQSLFGGANSAFNLGSQYLATSPDQARQDYMTTQRAALAPGREQDLATIRNQQYQTGRAGLATGGTTAGNMMQANPELAAYYNSIAKQDLALGTQAEQAAQQRQQFGLNLFGTGGGLLTQNAAIGSQAYSPLQTQLGLANTIEGYGQQPFALSQNLATAQSQANANAGQLYMQPQAAAANAYAQYQGYSPMGTALSGAGSAFGGSSGGGFGSTGGWFDNLLGNPSTASRYGTNAGSQQTSMLAAQDMGFF